MFSGIIEATGKVLRIEKEQENLHFTLSSPFVNQLKIDQSIAHNGVCLTVVKRERLLHGHGHLGNAAKVEFGKGKEGDLINLERSMMLNERLDGHIVQGHVDQTAVCTSVKEADGSWYYTFTYDTTPGHVTVEKGSIAVNGVSLTVVNSQPCSFQVAIIPYTYQFTNFHTLREGSIVNLEFDIIGKYVARLMNR